MEALVLAMVSIFLWMFGASGVLAELASALALTGLVALWAVRLLLEGSLTWNHSPVTACVAGIFLLGAWQLVPLPRQVLQLVSPGSARVYEQLLPAQPEALPFDERTAQHGPAPGSTISLYPGATRARLVQLLALLLLFSCVQNNLASPARLWRLCLVVVVNGAIISLFVLVQAILTRSRVSMTWDSAALATGIFPGRNRFGDYVALCIALAVGLFLCGKALGLPWGNARKPTTPSLLEASDAPRGLLHDPGRLWLAFALALLLGGLVFSESRAGFVAVFGGAGLTWLTTGHGRRVRWRTLLALAVPLLLAVGLVGWLGFDWTESRVLRLFTGAALEDRGSGRLDIWSRGLAWVAAFPLWGTGYGTFPYVEVLRRAAPGLGMGGVDLGGYAAHNAYLETLVEGGVARLSLALLAIGCVYRTGNRVLQSVAGKASRGLVIGVLFAFTTLVIHTFFGNAQLNPGFVVIAAVVLAQLCGLDPRASHPGVRLGGLAPAAAGITLLLLALVVLRETGNNYRAHQYIFRYALAADSAAPDRDRQIALLSEAVRYVPGNARLRGELAEVNWAAYQEGLARLRQPPTLAAAAARDVSSGMQTLPGVPLAPLLRLLGSVPLGAEAAAEPAPTAVNELARRYLVAALSGYLEARDACPLLALPQVRLAGSTGYLAGSEGIDAYLERSRVAAPFDPGVWYLTGMFELLGGNKEEALRDWRQSLELSDRHEAAILRAVLQQEGVRGLLSVVPPRPELLLRAAKELSEPETAEGRQALLDEGLRLLDRAGGQPAASDWAIRARLLEARGSPREALAAYRAALAQSPRDAGWRFELARLLCKEGRLHEARLEVEQVLLLDPKFGPGRQLANDIDRETARLRHGGATVDPGITVKDR